MSRSLANIEREIERARGEEDEETCYLFLPSFSNDHHGRNGVGKRWNGKLGRVMLFPRNGIGRLETVCWLGVTRLTLSLCSTCYNILSLLSFVSISPNSIQCLVMITHVSLERAISFVSRISVRGSQLQSHLLLLTCSDRRSEAEE